MFFAKKILPLALLATLVVVFYKGTDLAKVDELICISQYGPCSPSLEKLLTNTIGEKESYKKVKEKLATLLDNNILVKDYAIQFIFPDRIDLMVFERKANFAIEREAESVYLLDKEGYVIQIVKETGLPLLESKQLILDIGERVNERNLFGSKLFMQTFSNYEVTDAFIEKEQLVIELEGNLTVIFPLEGDRNTLLGALRLILTEMSKENIVELEGDLKRVYEIDLRFKNPVLR